MCKTRVVNVPTRSRMCHRVPLFALSAWNRTLAAQATAASGRSIHRPFRFRNVHVLSMITKTGCTRRDCQGGLHQKVGSSGGGDVVVLFAPVCRACRVGAPARAWKLRTTWKLHTFCACFSSTYCKASTITASRLPPHGCPLTVAPSRLPPHGCPLTVAPSRLPPSSRPRPPTTRSLTNRSGRNDGLLGEMYMLSTWKENPSTLLPAPRGAWHPSVKCPGFVNDCRYRRMRQFR
jgi:hypothetical protein